MRTCCLLIFLMSLSAITPGCAQNSRGLIRSQQLALNPQYHIVEGLELPPVRGAPGSGAQALAAVIAFYDPELEAIDVAETLPGHEFEAEAQELILAARRNNLIASTKTGTWEELVDALKRGRPVIVRLNVPQKSHDQSRPRTPTLREWQVACGISKDSREIILARENNRVVLLGRDQFIKQWQAARSEMILIGDF